MATRTTVLLVDDVDGGEADETITFAIDGVEYEIDVSEDHATELRNSFEVWREAARRIGGRQTPRGSLRPVSRELKRTVLPDARPGFSVQERKSMQKFAIANGMNPPAERGRIAQEVSNAWIEAGRPI